jgi:hypothetical protein
MKTLFNYPVLIYGASGIACLCIMVIVDFVLGVEAEHLNAWVIINRLFGNETDISDSLAIRHLGLFGAAVLMLVLNSIFGFVLIQLLKLVVRIVQS